MKHKYSFFKRNGLSVVLLALMLISLTGQALTGFKEYNNELHELGGQGVSLRAYLASGHFLQATFENWESEFLQMAIYVILTISLFQIGSAESKHPGRKEPVDRVPKPHSGSPWPVRRGGTWLKLYSNSLSILFLILFIVSFILHFYGSLKDYNTARAIKGEPLKNWQDYAASSRFWFESFQNWQSEFLAIASIVIFTIWFRQKGSPESKPVDAPYRETGE